MGTSPTDASLWKVNYEYGEIDASGNVNTAKNDGNIARQTISFSGLANPFIQTYKYDSVNRITEARETSGGNQTWKQNWNYDRYGNRTSFNQIVGQTQLVLDNKTNPTIDQNTNRFNLNQGYTYDKNGNLTIDADNRQFYFNGDNKQTEVRDANGNTVGQYFYDGEGKRVKKIGINSQGNQETTVFVYSGAQLIAEYSTAAPPTNPTTSYTATDPLGSPRVITNAQGEITSRRDFMPFGEELYPDEQYRKTSDKYGVNDSVRQRFTGYQKDIETNLDYAEARYYNNQHGRFTAVDPLLASGKSANPQSFNRYAYAMNRSLALTDKSGMQAGEIADDVYQVWCPAYEWVSRTFSYGGDSVTTREQIPAAIKYYNYTQSGDLGLPDRSNQVTRQLDQFVNSRTDPSIQAFGVAMGKVRTVMGYVPFAGQAMEAQLSGTQNDYKGFAFHMGMAGVDAATLPVGGAEEQGAKFVAEEGAEVGGTRLARMLGTEGENAVGISGPKSFIESITGTTKSGFRIPDRLTSSTLEEVKNVKYLSFTNQIKDFHLYSQREGLEFILHTRHNTIFSRPLQNIIDQGSITVRHIQF